MTSITEANLKNAAQVYAVANTPIYLMRRLREDSTVQEIARSFSGEDILEELRRSLVVTPETILDYVRPYIFLVALSMKPTIEHLNQTLQISDVQKWDWFDYLRRVLVETYIPTTQQFFKAYPQVVTTSMNRSDAPVERVDLKVS